MTDSKDKLEYKVPGMTCGHCEAAIKQHVSAVAGVEQVLVSLDTKRVEVRGHGLNGDAVETAIDEAGYEAEAA